MISNNNKTFISIINSEHGKTSSETVVMFTQFEDILTSEYSVGKIKIGHLIGLEDEQGNINMRYHQFNNNNK